jgi:hypothetical protein
MKSRDRSVRQRLSMRQKCGTPGDETPRRARASRSELRDRPKSFIYLVIRDVTLVF